MKKVFALAAALVAVLTFASVAPSAAEAGSGAYISIGSHGYGHHNYKHHRGEGYSGGLYYTLKHFKGHGRHHGHKPKHSGYSAGRGCHFVSKEGYWHGRPAIIGGTLCYDAHGNGYIVKGSRHLVRYY